MSAVETLLVWEDLETLRYELRNNTTGGTQLSGAEVLSWRAGP